MRTSYQNEMPRSRVNITLNIEKNGAQNKTELPFKLLVIGKFSHKADKSHIGFRDRINVNQSNLNEVIQKFSPKLDFIIPGFQAKKQNLKIHLNFNHYCDFQPEHILQQIAPLKRLLAARNLLKELKSHLIDNGDLKNTLQKMLHQKKQIKQIYKKLSQNHENS